MKLSVGYNPADRERLMNTCLLYSGSIGEVYFSYFDMPSGRSQTAYSVDENGQPWLIQDLLKLNQVGIKANLLLNANCYGANSMKASFYTETACIIEKLRTKISLSGITTTSPMIASFIKKRFSDLSVRASINMNIHGIDSMSYITELFDEFYLTREYNRNLREIEKARVFCDRYQKKLYLLANSGCLNECPSHVFHDNLVAHESEIDIDDFKPFEATCWKYLENTENRRRILQISNWIRPEELHLLDPYFDGAKIATRSSQNAFRIVAAYAKGVWHGNVLDLTEPSHSILFQNKILNNDLFPDGFLKKQMSCSKDCDSCGYCEKVFDEVTKMSWEGNVC